MQRNRDDSIKLPLTPLSQNLSDDFPQPFSDVLSPVKLHLQDQVAHNLIIAVVCRDGITSVGQPELFPRIRTRKNIPTIRAYITCTHIPILPANWAIERIGRGEQDIGEYLKNCHFTGHTFSLFG